MSDINISKLINGANEAITAYTLANHDYLDETEILPFPNSYEALEGDLIRGNSFTLANSKLSAFNLTGAIVYPYPGSSFTFRNLAYVNAESEALIATTEVNEVVVEDCLFERFVFNDTAIKPNLLQVRNSVFDNQNLAHDGLIGFRLAHIFYN